MITIKEIEIAKNNERALNELVRDYLPFIRATAAKYHFHFMGFDDVTQELSIAFVHAVQTFDDKQNCGFITYATKVMRNRMLSLLQHDSIVDNGSRSKNTPMHYQWFDNIDDWYSVYSTIANGKRKMVNYKDMIKPYDSEDYREYLLKLVGRVTKLSAKERDILISHYGLVTDHETLAIIGDRYGISSERVRQIESRAIRKIRQFVAQHGEIYE